jgi:hypothetical protein
MDRMGLAARRNELVMPLIGATRDPAASQMSQQAGGGTTVNVGPVFLLTPAELTRIMEQAERGGDFGGPLPQIHRQGAY